LKEAAALPALPSQGLTMTDKLTPWFPAHIKPVRVGVYEIKEPDGTLFYNKWDGKNWHWGSKSKYKSEQNIHPMNVADADRLIARWRGLSQPTKD